MNIEVVELIAKANKIITITGNGSGTKYPKSLKNIIVTLRQDHNLSVKDIIKHIPISSYSAREWPRQNKDSKSFNKVIVQKNSSSENLKVSKNKIVNYEKELNLIIFNQRALIALITLLIFESLVIHLVY